MRKQQTFDSNPEVIQQINFTKKIEHTGNITMFFIIEEFKETILDLLQITLKVLYSH